MNPNKSSLTQKYIVPPSEVKATFTGQLSVRGVGRVGSYHSAVKGKYCRSRRYWAIQEFGLGLPHMPNFFEERTDLGKFKTKTAAVVYLLEIANSQNVWSSSSNINEYIKIDLNKKLPSP